MNRLASPLVRGVYDRVWMCLILNRRNSLAKRLDLWAEPLSVITCMTLTPLRLR